MTFILVAGRPRLQATPVRAGRLVVSSGPFSSLLTPETIGSIVVTVHGLREGEAPAEPDAQREIVVFRFDCAVGALRDEVVRGSAGASPSREPQTVTRGDPMGEPPNKHRSPLNQGSELSNAIGTSGKSLVSTTGTRRPARE